ncbi:MAG TPA: DUF4920 domain-containing protein [Flavobacterium sp.]|nr:DUF4920 domain-containing protein [Flavobacterium sp.]
MKNVFILACSLFLFASCADKKEQEKADPAASEENTTVSDKDMKAEYASFGDKIGAEGALSEEQMLAKYKSLKKGDTIAIKFKSKINSVCKKKGCWMRMELADQSESLVKFKDYAFFVPMNADSQEAVVSGKAFIDEVSVAELKHLAKDAGKPHTEIDKIKEPKITYAFLADGVLISK